MYPYAAAFPYEFAVGQCAQYFEKASVSFCRACVEVCGTSLQMV